MSSVGDRVPAPPAAMLAKYGLAASKQRGQSFLADTNVARKVVAAAGVSSEDVVVEVGPGFGALTFFLARAAEHVVAVEIDAGIARAFEEEYGGLDAITLEKQDILRFDMQEAAQRLGASGLIVVGNIPYNVTSPLLTKLIEDRRIVRRAVLMIQAEVAARIVALPGERAYSGLSVVTQHHATVRRLFTVSASCFHPRPKVDSGVIEVSFESPPERASDPGILADVVRASFGNRRKMLRQSLRAMLKDAGISASELEAISGIALSRRGETLSGEEFDRLALAFGQSRG